MCTRKYIRVYLDNIYVSSVLSGSMNRTETPANSQGSSKNKKNIFFYRREQTMRRCDVGSFVVRYLKNFFILVYTLYSDDHDDMLICTNIHPYKKYFIL